MREGARSGLMILALLGSGCSGIPDNFREPDVRLDHVVVRGVGLSGGTLDLVVQVANPNNFSLQATKLEVGVDVESSHLGDITYDDDFSVSENGQTTLTLPLRFGWSGVGSRYQGHDLGRILQSVFGARPRFRKVDLPQARHHAIAVGRWSGHCH